MQEVWYPSSIPFLVLLCQHAVSNPLNLSIFHQVSAFNALMVPLSQVLVHAKDKDGAILIILLVH